MHTQTSTTTPADCLESGTPAARIQVPTPQSITRNTKERPMNSYEPQRPRTAIALAAAAALTAITIGILVVVPAKFDGSHHEARILAAAKARSAAPIEVAISPAQINVVGVRQPELASAQLDRPVVTPIATR